MVDSPSSRPALFQEFWAQLFRRNQGRLSALAGRKPPREHHWNLGAGKSGLSFSYNIYDHKGYVALYIDCDPPSHTRSKRIFDALYRQRDVIERDMGTPLIWERGKPWHPAHLGLDLTSGGLARRQTWNEVQDDMIEAMELLLAAVRPRLEMVEG